jgi:ADP-ribose pyrophosphatase
MTLKPWKRLSGETLFRNRWWEYRRDETVLPGGGRGEYHYVHTEGSSMVVPVMSDGRIVMVEQYRYLCARPSIEFPCGSVKKGGDHEQTAHLELREETGYEATDLILAGEFNPYNGVTDELCRVYVAGGLVHVGGTPDETEEFEMALLTPDEIDQKVRTGLIWDGMSIAGWHLVRSRDLVQ